MEIKFVYEKETKNTLRFKEDSDAPAIGTLYVQKLALTMLGIEKGEALRLSIEKGEPA